MSGMTRRQLLRRAAAGIAAPAGGTAVAGTDAVQVRRQDVGPLPVVNLVSLQGRVVALDQALAFAGPLILNFIFTTCSSSCSMQTAQLVKARKDWLAAGARLQIVSITIDPDNDTPQQLARFADGFGIREGWTFYTGRSDDLLTVQRHFDVYRGSKAAHPPVLLLRAAPAAPWMRVEGFPGSEAVLARLRELAPKA